jgi:membrane protease YdiL (CAAX protease family)
VARREIGNPYLGATELTKTRARSPRHIVLLALAFEGGLAAMALVLGSLSKHPPTGQIHVSWQVGVWGLIATSPLILLMLWSARSAWPPLELLRQEIDRVIVPLFAECSLLELALIAALAGFGEEMLFRGVLQTNLADLWNPWLALAVASTAFGLLHLITPIYALLAGLIGAYLGYLLILGDNLLLPISVHSLYDFVALTFLVRRHRRRH